MRANSFRMWWLVGALAVLSMQPSAAPAQQGASSSVRIKKMTGEPRETPEYNIKRAYPRGRILEWYMLGCEYETREDWLDELEFTFYALIKTKDNREPYVLLKNTTTYVNIEKGAHKAVSYIHPSTIRRFGAVERMAVEIRQGGRMVGMESRPSSNQRWWEQLPPKEGLLLPTWLTPFYLINFDDYEAIKQPGAGQ